MGGEPGRRENARARRAVYAQPQYATTTGKARRKEVYVTRTTRGVVLDELECLAARLRVELARTKSLQRELQREIAATETYMARLHSINTPFNRLPLELLDVIFAHVVNREADLCTFP